MPPTSDRKRAWASFMLGRAWFEKQRDTLALPRLLEAVSLWPDLALAHRYLAYIYLRAEDFQAALVHCNRAKSLAQDDLSLPWELEQLASLAGAGPAPDIPDHPGGKLRFRSRYDRHHHRSGWHYAVNSLYPLHNSSGTLFESFLEDPFAWQHRHPGLRSGPELLHYLLDPKSHPALNAEEQNIIPFREPWVGFMHNPPRMPSWFHPEESPQGIFSKRVWQESMESCQGLFALSEYHAQWLRAQTGKPVSALLHPTEVPARLFSIEAFMSNPQKKVVQVGWWLRSTTAIYRLPLGYTNAMGYGKVRLSPDFADDAAQQLADILAAEIAATNPGARPDKSNTEEMVHLDNEAYDELLSRNIVFIELYDASANNTVVECLVRATPLLVNPLPAVIEYLGPDYPFYYTDLNRAADMALDLGRVRAAHEHLRQSPLRHRLSGDYFRQSLVESEVYGLLGCAA